MTGLEKLEGLLLSGALLLAVPLIAGVAPAASAQIDVVQFSRDETPRKLTDDEVSRWAKSFGGLLKLSREAEDQLTEAGDGATKRALVEQTRTGMLSVLDANGFDEATFSNVHFNVVRAWTARQLEAHSGEIAVEQQTQQAKLEAVRESLTPEQYTLAKQELAAFENTLASYQNVPEGNIELVAKHADEITALLAAEPPASASDPGEAP